MRCAPQCTAFTSEFTRAIRSGYDAAASPRTIGNWSPMQTDFNQLISTANPRMRARVRDLIRNFPFASAVNGIVAFTIGRGSRFQSLATLPDGTPDMPRRRKIEERFRIWMEKADVAGKLHFYELQSLAKTAGMRVRRICGPVCHAPRPLTAPAGSAAL